MSLHRRDLLRLLPASLALLGASGLRRRTAGSGAERRFLFVYADGGWDPSFVFNTAFDNPNVDMPPDGANLAQQGDLQWVSGPTRPSVDAFFSRYAARTAILNGVEVRSIAHERCQRIVMTGTSDPGAMDIPSRIAAGAAQHLPLGHLVVSGPAFLNAEADGVVRVGGRGQLSNLLSGTCVSATDPALALPAQELVDLEDAYVRARIEAVRAGAAPGAPVRLTEAYGRALDDAAIVRDTFALPTSGEPDGLSQLLSAVGPLATGLSRCAIVHDLGLFNGRWDHHADITRQSPSFDGLFRNLTQLARTLEETPGTWGTTLLDEITVVVFSEMGRYPRLNVSGGKDHWMTTSMMFFGGGIRGGQVVGAYDADVNGTPLVPETGELDPEGRRGGVVPQAANVGATLLALADMDPADAFGPDVAPIRALLDA